MEINFTKFEYTLLKALADEKGKSAAAIIHDLALDYLNDHLSLVKGIATDSKPSSKVTMYTLTNDNKGLRSIDVYPSSIDFWKEKGYSTSIPQNLGRF